MKINNKHLFTLNLSEVVDSIQFDDGSQFLFDPEHKPIVSNIKEEPDRTTVDIMLKNTTKEAVDRVSEDLLAHLHKLPPTGERELRFNLKFRNQTSPPYSGVFRSLEEVFEPNGKLREMHGID